MKINWPKLDSRLLGKVYFLVFIHFRGILYLRALGALGFAISLIDLTLCAGAYYAWERKKRIKWLHHFRWLVRFLSYQLFIAPLFIIGFIVLIVTHDKDPYYTFWLVSTIIQMPAFYALYTFCKKSDLL